MTAHAQKPELVSFETDESILIGRGGVGQLSRLPAVEECGSAGSDCIIFSKYIDHKLKISL
jgi:hypothetical protein